MIFLCLFFGAGGERQVGNRSTRVLLDLHFGTIYGFRLHMHLELCAISTHGL